MNVSMAKVWTVLAVVAQVEEASELGIGHWVVGSEDGAPVPRPGADIRWAQSDGRLAREVAQLWGGRHEQLAPSAAVERRIGLRFRFSL